MKLLKILISTQKICYKECFLSAYNLGLILVKMACKTLVDPNMSIFSFLSYQILANISYK